MKILLANNLEIILILHNIRSIYNVGSIFRTADALKISKIYLTGITPSPIDSFNNLRKDFQKTALGAEKNINWIKKIQIIPLLKKLKQEKYKIFAIEQAENSIYYYQLKIKKRVKIVLILGNEVNGLDKRILKQVDEILEIPMLGLKESLNVSIAFAIVGYHLRFLV